MPKFSKKKVNETFNYVEVDEESEDEPFELELPPLPEEAPKRPKRTNAESNNRPVRNAVFTVNGLPDDFVINSRQVESVAKLHGIKYLCGQLEKGATGNIHWQGYLELENPMRIKAISQILALIFEVRAHVEPRKGTAAQARDYCMKDESRIGSFYEVSQCWYCHHCKFVEHIDL